MTIREIMEKFLMAFGALFLVMTAFHWVKKHVLPSMDGYSETPGK